MNNIEKPCSHNARFLTAFAQVCQDCAQIKKQLVFAKNLWYKGFHCCAPVAQLDRVPDYESGGREFESLRARH